MLEIKGRIRILPQNPKKGDLIEVKTTINHPMENGFRKDEAGNLLPKKYIASFRCTYNSTEVFRSEWQLSVAANPFLSFFLVANKSGHINCEWIEDSGQVFKETVDITVG